MERKILCCRRLFLLLIIFFLVSSRVVSQDDISREPSGKIKLGGIVDLTNRMGKEERVAMQMAIEDFYPDVNTRPILYLKNSRGHPLQAYSSAKNLIKKRVAAIIGLGTWQEAVFVAELGNKSEVPILALADHVPSWACLHLPFLVNAAHNQFSEMKAVAAVISSWKWRKVNIIYEDISSDVSGIIPYLISALQDVGAEISDLLPLPPVRSNFSLSAKLEHLKDGQCRVFIVHTSAKSASDIFIEAKNLRMMNKEFVWITTEAITNLIDTYNASVIASMQGVLGVRSYFSRSGSTQFQDFRSKFHRNFDLVYPKETYSEPGIYALQAYDAMWAVALAMEGVPNSRNATNVSVSGKKLLSRIFLSNFEGFTGVFKFRKRMLTPAHIFRIVNVVGKSYRELGYWTENLGFSESLGLGQNYNKSMRNLGQVFWPGGPWSVPRGWALPTNAHPLTIGVPMGNTHKKFVEVVYDHQQKDNVSVSGFSIDVFRAALKFLPYDLPYHFVPFNGTYDSLVQQVNFQIFDAVVADTAIVAARCKYAEFSQPYADSGLQILIYARRTKLNRAWLLTKPFKPSMWIATALTNVYIGIIFWVIERKANSEHREGTKWEQIGTMLSSSFIRLFSLKGDGMRTLSGRIVMVGWLFLALLITQSFTASLSSILTVEQLDPKMVDVETLRKSGAKVGCDANSFVAQYLEVVQNFNPDNIVRVHSEEEYAQGLVNGDIAAAFLEIPYIKLITAKYCKDFITSGPTYKVGGFGFVFPKGSPYLPDISEAVVEVSESGQLKELQDSLTSSYKCAASDSSDDDDRRRLDLDSFLGLFVISLAVPAIAAVLHFFVFPYICHQQPPQLQQQQAAAMAAAASAAAVYTAVTAAIAAQPQRQPLLPPPPPLPPTPRPLPLPSPLLPLRHQRSNSI